MLPPAVEHSMETNKIWLRVSRTVQQTRDSVQVFFVVENEQPLAYEAGQFITLIFPDLGPSEIRRSYSLSSSPAAEEPLSICVKRTVNGSVLPHAQIACRRPVAELAAGRAVCIACRGCRGGGVSIHRRGKRPHAFVFAHQGSIAATTPAAYPFDFG